MSVLIPDCKIFRFIHNFLRAVSKRVLLKGFYKLFKLLRGEFLLLVSGCPWWFPRLGCCVSLEGPQQQLVASESWLVQRSSV